MREFLKAAAVASVVLLPMAAANAQQQGSNQAGDYAASWNAVRQGYGTGFSEQRGFGAPYQHEYHHQRYER